MLIACISDIHGNLPALEAALEDAAGRGADTYLCAGDITGYGPFPVEVCRLLEERRIPTIIGNYDRKVLAVAGGDTSRLKRMKKKKRRILEWTAGSLGKKEKKYLKSLPGEMTVSLPGGRELLLVHGSTRSDEGVVYPSATRRTMDALFDETRPDVLIAGHTHIPFARKIDGVLVVNCGSAGQPVDGDPRGAYALVYAGNEAPPRARIVRFDYDIERTIDGYGGTGLPKGLRSDLANGDKQRYVP